MLGRVPGLHRPQRLGQIKDDLIAETDALKVGDVRDLANFTSAVIDQRSFTKQRERSIGRKNAADATVVAGGVDR